MNPDSLAWLTEHTRQVLARCRRQSGDFVFYVPGGDDKYPAFWIRDAVMEARSGLIPRPECREMLRVILEHQNGPKERSLAHGLRVEPWAIADHIVLPGFGPAGRPPGAVFFPGTYSSTDDQGTGQYGLRSAADDVYETVRLARLVGAGPDVLERLHRGMLSLTTDGETGLCWNGPEDWAAANFHDGLRPMGLVALPSCLRFRAARDLLELYRQAGDETQAAFYEQLAAQLADSIPRLLQRPDGWLNNASEVNRQPDVWATSLAVYEGVLKGDARRAACEAMLRALRDGSVARHGYLRHIPAWADAEPGQRIWENEPSAWHYGHYQNGGYWPQPVGWYATAVAEVSRPEAEQLADDFLEHTRTHADDGAPYEWINPDLGIREGRWYGPSAALPLEAFRRLVRTVTAVVAAGSILACAAGCQPLAHPECEVGGTVSTPALRGTLADGVLGFEEPGAWTTAPVDELQAIAPDKFSSARADVDPLVRKRTMAELADGARAVDAHVTEGRRALRWDRHPEYPTLRSTRVPADWSAARAVAIDIYSEAATGELLCIAFKADAPETPHLDWWYWPLRIDWEGARTVVLPLAEFRKQGAPTGWTHISALAFCTKMFAAQPHPQTALTLDNLRMLGELPPDLKPAPPAATGPATTAAEGFFYKVNEKEWQRDALNHPGRETGADEPVYAPYAYQNYYQTERARFGYYPKFLPGYVSFDPRGRAYIFSRDWIQFKGADGRWGVGDLQPVLTGWAREQGWAGLALAWNLNEGEKTIRFDRDGDAYALATIGRLDRGGGPAVPAESVTLLLHSRDGLKTWTVHNLGPVTASMERLDGHNLDCLDRPPVVLLSGHKEHGNTARGYAGTQAAAFILLPAKNADGSLALPEPVRLADFAISVPVHSGDGNMLITSRGKIYAVYSWYRAALQNQALADQGQSGPPIPPEHPGLGQTFRRAPAAPPESSANGTPIFIVTYDLATRAVSEPVYILSGGSKMDDHNWPAISIDGEGILHVLANGHQDPANYAHSLKPYDISAWSAPQYVLDPGAEFTRLSYATLNCDRAGNLYSVMRNSGGRYNNRLSLFVKPAGRDWQPPQDLVIPFSMGYKNWGHKMAYNPAADQLSLSFYSQSNLRQLYPDTWAFDLFIWPDREPVYHTGRLTPDGLHLNYGPPDRLERGFAYSLSWAGEPASLIRQCPDGRWKLAVSGDFR